MLDRKQFEAIIREAGQIALALWPGGGGRPQSWKKDNGGLVSDADIAVDAYLKEQLKALLPAAAWLSEETADDEVRLLKRLVWLVDPIDGTRDFLNGKPGWTISVALVSEGKALISALYAPARDEYWCSYAGQGSYVNGGRLEASNCTQLAGARIPADQLSAEDGLFTMVEKPNSIALRAAMVAANRADALVALRWGYEWDIAAVTLIAQEAGADVTDAFGAPLKFNKRDPRAFGLIVCSSALHPMVVAHIAERAENLSGRRR